MNQSTKAPASAPEVRQIGHVLLADLGFEHDILVLEQDDDVGTGRDIAFGSSATIVLPGVEKS